MDSKQVPPVGRRHGAFGGGVDGWIEGALYGLTGPAPRRRNVRRPNISIRRKRKRSGWSDAFALWSSAKRDGPEIDAEVNG